MQITAKARYIRISPRKVRLIADLVRGKRAKDAEQALKFLPHKPAGVIRRLIHSALATAEQRGEVDSAQLVVKKICVDSGPTFKTWLPRSQGRVNRLLKRSSHIQLVLGEK